MPKSIAIIMDGNRRYATKQNKKKHLGHSDGLKNLENTVFWCKQMGIKQLTVYALSKDNLKRPKVEVDTLMNLCKNEFNGLSKPGGSIDRNRIKIRIFGDISLLPEDVQDVMRLSERRTQDYENGTLNICMCYSSKHEIFDAIENLAQKKAAGEVSKITPENFDKELLGGENVKPDILIRTSNEVRLSNFMLY